MYIDDFLIEKKFIPYSVKIGVGVFLYSFVLLKNISGVVGVRSFLKNLFMRISPLSESMNICDIIY